MKLWQGWHNTGQYGPYFHYGPLGCTEKQMGNTGTNIKTGGNEKWLSGNFLSNSRKICHHFAFVVHRKTVS